MRILHDWLGQSEALAVDLVVKIAPWAAPAPTAYLVYARTMAHLRWPAWVAIVAALVIESLGLATVATALELREYNQEKRKSDPAAPFGLAALLAGVYLVVALLLTVVLDIVPILSIVAPGAFPFLSLCGVLVLAVRSDHRRRLQTIAEEKAFRRNARHQVASAARMRRTSESIAQSAGSGNGHEPHVCAWCERKFSHQNGLNAHLRFCAEYRIAKERSDKSGSLVGQGGQWTQTHTRGREREL